MPTSLKIGSIGGIEIGIHWSWIFIFLLLTWSFATDVLDQYFPGWSNAARWIAGALTSLIFFVSLLLHELAHSFVAKSRGINVRGITLFILGGVSNLGGEPRSAKEEFAISVVGPLTSLALGAVFAVGWGVAQFWNPGIAGISALLATLNVTIAIFNILPGFPLDGGRVFRSLLWWRSGNLLNATQTASRVGEFFAYGLMAVGFVYFLFGNLVSGIWFFFIGLFLRSMSAGAYQQMLAEQTLVGVKAGDAASRGCVSVEPELSLQQLVEEYVLQQNIRCFPVREDGHLIGLITLDDVRQVPREEWALTPVRRKMVSLDKLHKVAPNEDLNQVMQMMSKEDINQVPVVEGESLVGMISRADIIRLMEIRRQLASDSEKTA